jgi:hypothetical protein
MNTLLPSGWNGQVLGRHDSVDFGCVCNGGFPGSVGGFVSRLKSKRVEFT